MFQVSSYTEFISSTEATRESPAIITVFDAGAEGVTSYARAVRVSHLGCESEPLAIDHFWGSSLPGI